MSTNLTALRENLQEQGIDVLRIIYADVLGITRSKDINALFLKLFSNLGEVGTHCNSFVTFH